MQWWGAPLSAAHWSAAGASPSPTLHHPGLTTFTWADLWGSDFWKQIQLCSKLNLSPALKWMSKYGVLKGGVQVSLPLRCSWLGEFLPWGRRATLLRWELKGSMSSPILPRSSHRAYHLSDISSVQIGQIQFQIKILTGRALRKFGNKSNWLTTYSWKLFYVPYCAHEQTIFISAFRSASEIEWKHQHSIASIQFKRNSF